MKSRSLILNGLQTEVVIQNYADRVLVLVTQLGKVGHLIQASIPATVPLQPLLSTEDGLPLIEVPPSVELSPLFGSAPSQHLSTLHYLYSSHIATLIWTTTAKSVESSVRRNVIVGLGLRKLKDASSDDTGLSADEQTIYKGVMRMIVELLGDRDG